MNRVPDLAKRQGSCPRSAASSPSPGPSRSNALSTPRLDEPPARKRARRDGWDSGDGTTGHRLQEVSHSSVNGNARAHFGDHYGDVHYHNRDAGPASYPCQEHKLDLVTHIMESLSFEQMDLRRETISRAHLNTCKWIFDRPEYIDWRDMTLMPDHGGFLWIKSKPGAGKSTLMKFLLQTAHKHLPGDRIISFFFNARGERLERSLEGCYRGLLHQLLTKVPRLQDVLNHSKTSSDSLQQWSLVLLREMFSEAILQLGEESLTCFIDALDECPEVEIRDMIDFFEELGGLATEHKINLRVCLSSRYYPQVSIANCRQIRLDQQDGHQQDITKYVKSKLKVGKGKTADAVRLAVHDKAQGVFMWVVLVVRILNEESDHGSNNAELRRCLERIPSKLHDLFQDILNRGIHDDENLLPILQWISFSRRPLKREELYFAVRSGEPDFDPARPWDLEEDSLEVMDLFILNASKGLAEATKGKTPRIQFIHESVRDYLRETGFQILAPDLSVSLQGSSHDYIKHCCYRWMSQEIERKLALPESLPKISDVRELRELRNAALKKFPFLEYSVNNVLPHAELAFGEGISQDRFVEGFRWTPWVRINDLFAKQERDRHRYLQCNEAKACVLVAHKALMLLSAQLQAHTQASRKDELDAALRMCIINHDTDSFIRILESSHLYGLVQLQGKTIEAAVKTKRLDFLRMIFMRGLYDMQSMSSHRPFYAAVRAGNAEILQFLFEQGATMNNRDDSIFRVSRKGHVDALRVLIENGADVNKTLSNGTSPLLKACFYGHTATAQTLIEHGAYVNPTGVPLKTPLIEACAFGYRGVVQVLLQNSADPNFANEQQETPLLQACFRGYEDIACMLLEHGANPDLAGKDRYTPLLRACSEGYRDVARLLLNHGADPNLTDGFQNTPLVRACSKGYDDIARILLASGADVNICRREELLALVKATNLSDYLLQTLISHGFDPSSDTRNGSEYLDAIFAASLRHDQVMVRNLLANSTGVQHQEPNRYREVVQGLVTSYGTGMLELLLDESEGFRAQDKAIYREPLRQAEQLGYYTIASILRERGVTLLEDETSRIHYSPDDDACVQDALESAVKGDVYHEASNES